MHLPKLDMIVDTFIRIEDKNIIKYISQLRTELIPEIRKLQKKKAIIWYAFLVHDYRELDGRVPPTDDLFIHIRLGLDTGADVDKFIVEHAVVDLGPTKWRRRVRPAPMGRAYRQQRHYKHISIAITGKDIEEE